MSEDIALRPGFNENSLYIIYSEFYISIPGSPRKRTTTEKKHLLLSCRTLGKVLRVNPLRRSGCSGYVLDIEVNYVQILTVIQ